MPTYAKDRTHFNIAVFVLLKNQAGEYLLQQRINTSYMNGYWDCSGSGHLERHETLKQCAVRETQEECGLSVPEASLRLVHILQHDVGDWPYLYILFTSETFSGEAATHEPEKVQHLQWFAPENFPKKLTVALASYKNTGFSSHITDNYVDEVFHEQMTREAYDNNS